jgi:predicted Zn-dependent peptidase
MRTPLRSWRALLLSAILLAVSAASAPAPALADPSAAEILAASHLPAPIDAPLANDPMAVTVHRLSNGLTVYLSPMPSETSVQAWTVVRAGARNDPATATGLAHYLEHMLFKGTARVGTRDYAQERPHLDKIAQLYRQLRAAKDGERDAILAQIDAENQGAAKFSNPGELVQLLERLGISRFDAFTGWDITAYIHQVPANRIGQWAQIEADRYREPAFRGFYSELESVYEERNMRDTAERRTRDAQQQGLFPEHPYGTQQPIGTVEDLKTPGFNEMIEFHRTWYVPNNMAILLVGAVDAKTTIPVLEKAFASWTPRPLPTSLPGRIVPLTGRVEKQVLDKGPQSVTLAWLLPHGQLDPATWELIADLLGNPQGGLLQKELVLTRKLPRVTVSFSEAEDADSFIVQAGLADQQTHAAAEQLLLDVIARVSAGDFGEDLLASVVLNKRVADQRSIERADDRIGRLAWAFSEQRDWADLVARREKRAHVSKADVVREARAGLGSAYVAVLRKDGTYVPPKVDKPKITPVAVTRSELGEPAQSILAQPVEPIAPRWLERERDFQRGTLATGALVTSKNASTDLFEINYVFEGGTNANPRLCYALANLNLVGTSGLPSKAVQEKLYALAATVTGGCSHDFTYLTVSGIDENLEPTLAFVRAWLGKPELAAEDVRRATANDLRLRREGMDRKETRQGAAFQYLLWGGDSPLLQVVSNEDLQALTPALLASEIADLGSVAHATLYFGPRPLSEAAKAVVFGSARKPGVVAKPHKLVRSGKPEILFVPFVSADARIYLAIPGGPTLGPARAATQLFAGFAGSYTWEEIREARGLAYSVYTGYVLNERAQDDSGVIATVASQADKLPETVPVLLSLLADLRPNQTRFESAKASLDSEYRTDRTAPRDVPWEVFGWSRLGAEEDPRPREYELVQASTLESLTQLSLELTRRAPWRMVVIGDPERVDREMLRKIAPVRELAPEELFGYGPFPKSEPTSR